MVAVAAARPLQHAAVGRYRDDNVHDVGCGRHQPECVDGVVEAELGDGKHLQFAVQQVPEDVLKEPTVPLRLQPEIQIKVHHRESIFASEANPLGIGVDVPFTEFDEPPAGSQYLHTASNRFSGQRIQNDVHL